MERKIKIFKSFEEQEMYYLEYFANLTPSGRLQALAALQKKNNPIENSAKKNYSKAFYIWTLRIKNSFLF
jgi:hypothetical protein